MKTIYRITFLILISLIYVGCQREKGCSEEPSQTFYYNIDPYYKELVPFGKPGFTMELTDSATGQKVNFTFNGIDSGYWKELNQGLNPINCPKSDFDAYQYYEYKCISSNDSLLKLKICNYKYSKNQFPYIYTLSNFLHVDVEGEENCFLLLSNYERSSGSIQINGIPYDNILIGGNPSDNILPLVFFNNKIGIVAIRTKNQLWQQK